MSPKTQINTLVVSDIHLGALVSRAGKLSELLASANFKRLIILGDLFDNMNFNRLNKDNWDLLSLLRKLSNGESNKEVVWIKGNHDGRVAETMSQLLGIPMQEQYIWEQNGKRFLAIHGDKFDRFFIRNALISRVTQFIFLLLQNFDKEARHIIKFIEKSRVSFLRISNKVAEGAAKYAKEMNADYVFCGHTHKAMQKTFNDKKSSPIYYYNVGCWTRTPSTFAVIDEAGNVSLENFE